MPYIKYRKPVLRPTNAFTTQHELYGNHTLKRPYMESGELRLFCLNLAIAKDTENELMW